LWVAGASLAVGVTYKLVVAAHTLTVALGGVRMALISTGIGAAIAIVGALAAEYLVLGKNASAAAQALGEAGERLAFGSKATQAAQKEANLAQALNRIADPEFRGRVHASMGQPNFNKTLDTEQKAAEERLAVARKGLLAQKATLAVDERESKLVKEYLPNIKEKMERVTAQVLPSRRNLSPADQMKGLNDPTTFRMMHPLYRYAEQLAEHQERKTGEKMDVEMLYKRIRLAWLGEEYRDLRTRGESTPAGKKIVQEQEAIKGIEELRKLTGTKADDLLRDFKYPVQPRIGDMQGFADAIQLQALGETDLTRQNQQRQIEIMLEQLEGIKGVKNALEGLWKGNKDEEERMRNPRRMRR
jgi:hypothetical protein